MSWEPFKKGIYYLLEVLIVVDSNIFVKMSLYGYSIICSQYSWTNSGIDWNNFIRCMTLKIKMLGQLFRKAFFLTFLHRVGNHGNISERIFRFKFELNCLKTVLNFNSCEERMTFEVYSSCKKRQPDAPALFGQRG